VHIEVLDYQGMDDALDALFAKDGHWEDPPQAWQRPDQAPEQMLLINALPSCVERLPPKVAHILMMREWLDQDDRDLRRAGHHQQQLRRDAVSRAYADA
jgi:RNA polymerase sigma-70 factor (ECF subfamily)